MKKAIVIMSLNITIILGPFFFFSPAIMMGRLQNQEMTELSESQKKKQWM